MRLHAGRCKTIPELKGGFLKHKTAVTCIKQAISPFSHTEREACSDCHDKYKRGCNYRVNLVFPKSKDNNSGLQRGQCGTILLKDATLPFLLRMRKKGLRKYRKPSQQCVFKLLSHSGLCCQLPVLSVYSRTLDSVSIRSSTRVSSETKCCKPEENGN